MISLTSNYGFATFRFKLLLFGVWKIKAMMLIYMQEFTFLVRKLK